MRRFALVAVFAWGSAAGYAGEAPGERTEQTKPPADEQPSDRKRVPKEEPAKRSQVSLDDATAIVRQAYGGRVVSAAAATARPERTRTRESGYRVRVDVDGRVKTVFVDDRGRIHENAEY